ncbi:MAG: hypothetical protein L0332_17775 [Chloroflexi bacterium]|nr:hypothetical protein [Chloroflexota bacterium]MCI0728551.1 hypothetical protein [Chloroflexota bacterium]
MTNQVERSAFGALLRTYRRRCQDPERNGSLTQERLAEFLDTMAGLPNYSHVQVALWEKGTVPGSVIRQDNRQLLIGLIIVLYRCGGITTLDEANALLSAGDYRALNNEEIGQINQAWLPDETVKPGMAPLHPAGQGVVIHDRSYAFTSTQSPSPGAPQDIHRRLWRRLCLRKEFSAETPRSPKSLISWPWMIWQLGMYHQLPCGEWVVSARPPWPLLWEDWRASVHLDFIHFRWHSRWFRPDQAE